MFTLDDAFPPGYFAYRFESKTWIGTLGYNPGRVPVTTVDQAIHVIGYERIRSVLSARQSFDDLTADEQAVALAELDAHLEELPRDDDATFFAKLRAAGAPIHGEHGRGSAAKEARPRRSAKSRGARARSG